MQVVYTALDTSRSAIVSLYPDSRCAHAMFETPGNHCASVAWPTVRRRLTTLVLQLTEQAEYDTYEQHRIAADYLWPARRKLAGTTPAWSKALDSLTRCDVGGLALV